uniref:NTF2-related export protein n=1 Tax=Saimiri boliviensis boliviensis TaxID=39432 RepID=A0A2K6UDX4_SAIBB
MGDKPIWEQIGSSFIQHYYQLFDNDRTQLGAIYIDASCLTWEGQQFQGKAAIVEKLSVSRGENQGAVGCFPIPGLGCPTSYSLSCRAFHSRKSSTASRRRTISPRQIAASSAWLWASLRRMKTPSWDSTRCSS